jgi:hypothetical protein
VRSGAATPWETPRARGASLGPYRSGSRPPRLVRRVVSSARVGRTRAWPSPNRARGPRQSPATSRRNGRRVGTGSVGYGWDIGTPMLGIQQTVVPATVVSCRGHRQPAAGGWTIARSSRGLPMTTTIPRSTPCSARLLLPKLSRILEYNVAMVRVLCGLLLPLGGW